MRLELSRRAQADLDDIRDYSVAEFGVERAVAYLDAVESAFRRIVEFPDIGAVHPRIRPLTRSLGSQQHRIFYAAGDETILIIRPAQGGGCAAAPVGVGGATAIARTGDFAHLVSMGRLENDKMDGEVRAATLALLAGRAAGATVCPSEVARSIAAAAGLENWRSEMPAVHAAIDLMVAHGLVRLSWKGKAMPVRDGSYRIGRAGPEA